MTDTAQVTNGVTKIGIGKKVVTTKTKAAPKKEAKVTHRRAFDDDAKITVVVKDNPRREGTDLYKLYEVMKKCKTVGDFMEKGGRTSVLKKCVTKKWIKIS